jgi:membrane peptidoglycan carboxypeptidase
VAQNYFDILFPFHIPNSSASAEYDQSMQDLKHLVNRKKPFSFPKWFKTRKVNNTFNALKESKERKSRLRILLPVIALILAAYPLTSFVKVVTPKILQMKKRYGVKSGASAHGYDNYQSFRLAAEHLNGSKHAGNRLAASSPDGISLYFTIDPALQESVFNYMTQMQVPYGAFVAIEPKTGRVLALTGYSSMDPAWDGMSCFRLYPMASLFKIITASAALERKQVEPETMFAFRGYSYSENPRAWDVKPGQSGQQMQLAQAMGKSINPVFGRLASDVVGRENIMNYAQRFGFNQTLFPGTQVQPSRATTPQDDLELKLMGAGLGREVKISPLHAAVMMAALANQGTMMAPILAEEIRGRDNKLLFAERPTSIRRLVTQETASQLTRMLQTTVTSGTSRRAFHDRRGRPKLASISIAAKTGSIDGKEPEGKYTWFAAYAPAEDPKIAIVALVINQDRWKIKASHLGEHALELFFAEEGGQRQAMGPAGSGTR